jgi:two-component system chemotaxis response regulator CheY
VLICDDSRFQRALTRATLEAAGYAVCGEAGDGEEVTVAFAAERPEIVLLDLHMPGRDGLAALRHLHALDPSARIIICSAERRSFKVLEALRLGACDYVVKPWRAEALIAAVDAAVAIGRPLVVAGPVKDRALGNELERRGADVRGYVAKDELVALYRGAACLVLPSRYEGFGLTVVEAMACGTPVVAAPDEALREVAGDAAVFADPNGFADAIRRALGERDRLRAAGLERAKAFTWDETARRTAQVYRELVA